MLDKNNQFQHLEHNPLINLPKAQINISVLKHLSRPLQILDKDDSYLNFADPVCLYPAKLHNIPDKILPTQQNTQKQVIQQTRLTSIENAQFQFQQVKKMYERSRYRTQQNNTINNEEQEQQKNYLPKTKTLYNMFCLKQPYYCRFQNHIISKNNFANVFINVAGLNLQAKTKNVKSSSGMRKFPRINIGQKRFNTGNLIFDSSFESGNLLYVFEKSSQIDGKDAYEYQLILQNDTNTYGHNQWFFFRVQSLKPHSTVKFSILNLIKSDSLFNYGLKPLVYSQKQNNQKNICWIRRGQNVKYYQGDIRRENKKQNYHTLEFQYTFKQSKDWVYFCPSYPYTYTQMTSYIQNLYQQPEYKKCFTIKTVCETLGKNKINLISISTGQKMIEDCKVVWILARQHPAQTTGSYMIEGILRYLLPLISQAKSLRNSSLNQLHDYVFKIIPILNVDGVIHGNSRAQMIGLDPNRSWRRPRKSTNPVVYHLLKQILTYRSNISLILDLHSHSKKTGCFFYGNQFAPNSKLSKIYPTLICQNDQRFALKNCRYKGGYKTTARNILFKQLINCENVFTVECSLLGYLNQKTNRITQYTIQDYHQMGAKLIQTFFKLENIKLEKGVNQLLQEFYEKIDQICQIDSAKSDSGISDDQYEQIKELQKKLITIRKKKPVNNRKNNKSLTSNLIKNQQKDQNKEQKRACSLVKHKTKDIGSKLNNNNTTSFCHINDTQGKIINSKKSIKIDTNTQNRQSQKQNINNFDSCNNDQKNTISSLKQSYMKYLSSSKLYNEWKGKTDDTQKLQNKITKQFGVQALIQKFPIECQRKILQSSEATLNNLSIIMDSKVRPLLVLGNTCQNEYTVFGKTQISVQVNFTQDDPIKKQHKAISKLPKLMNMISVSKQKMKRMTLVAYKQNQHFSSGSPAARYNDVKSILYDQRMKKTKLAVNFRSSNV